MFDAGALVFNIRAAGVQVFEDQVKKADKAVDGLGKTTQSAAEKTEQLGRKQDKTTEQTRRQAKAQEDAARKTREYADAQEKVGKVLVTAGAAIVATTALTVKSAIDWESSWAGVTKTVDGTAEELAGVESGLRGLTSILPAAHGEVAAVAEAAGQLGVATPNVVAFTRTMIDLGETTNLSANDAATALARFMNVMGTAQGDVSNLGSAVVALGNNYATTEAEIVNMATRLSGAARQVGLTEGETLGLATALSSVGIEAEAGGSAVSKVMIDIAASVDEGGDRVAMFAKVAGVSAQEFTQQWKTNPGQALAGFVKGLADAELQGESTLGTLAELGITETRMRDALLRAAAASDQFTAAMDLGNDSYAENNALQEEAAKRYKTVESQLGIMRNRINDAAIDLGSVFLPVVADAAGAIGDFAEGVANLPQPLRDAVAEGGLAIGMIALLGGTAMIAVPKVIELAGQIRAVTAANTLMGGSLRGTAAFLTGPYGVALVATVTALTLLQSHVDSLKASTEEFQNVIQNASSAQDLFEIADQGTIISDLNKSIESAEKFQESLNTIATNDFARGMSISLTQLKGRLEDIGKEFSSLATTDLQSAQRGFRLLADDMELSKDQQIQLLDAMPEYKAALIEVANQHGINVTSADEAANATNLLELAQGDGADASKSAARGYIEAAEGAQALRKDLEQLLDVLNEANGVGQDAISKNIDYRDTLADVDEQIQKARDGADGYKLTLDQSTQAGRDNMRMLNDLAKDAWDAAEAQFALDGNTETYRQRLEESREALIQRAEDFGYTREKAEELADQILKIPSESEWKMIADTVDAETRIRLLKEQLDSIPGFKRVTLETVTYGNRTVSAPGFENADGNVIEAYANGGVRENHVAQMARAGAYRVWAEPETGGESYVPHAPSKRARSEQIMAETASILGGTYIPSGARAFADGGVGGGGVPEVRVILQPKGGIDILKYIDVKVEQGSNKLTNALRGG